MTESINCVCGHPQEDHKEYKRKSAGWYCGHSIPVYAANRILKCQCTEYRPEQPNIDASGEREVEEERESRMNAWYHFKETQTSGKPTSQEAVAFREGWYACSAYSKAQVIDEFVEKLLYESVFTKQQIEAMRSVAEEIKGEKKG